MEYIQCIGSNRIYVEQSNKEVADTFNILSDVEDIDDSIIKFNRILFSMYNFFFLLKTDEDVFNNKYKEVLDSYSNKDITLNAKVIKYIKDKYDVNSFYANSIMRLAKGAVESDIELNKLYIEETKEKLKLFKNQLAKNEKKLKAYLDLRYSLDEYIKTKSYLKNKSLKIKGLPHIQIKGNKAYVSNFINFKRTVKEISIFKFKHEYLNKKINELRTSVYYKELAIIKNKNKLIKLEKLPKKVFGTKKYLKEYIKNTNKENAKYYKTRYLSKKYSNFSISGRNDSNCGNFVFKATPLDKKTKEGFDLFDIDVTLINGKAITFKNIYFPYLGNEFKRALDLPIPIAYTLVRKVNRFGKYYQLKVTFDMANIDRYETLVNERRAIEKEEKELKESQEEQVIKDKSIKIKQRTPIQRDLDYIKANFKLPKPWDNGIIGIDFNYKHLDISYLDRVGNLRKSFTISYDVSNNKQENYLSLRKALIEVFEIASKYNCPIAIESLRFVETKFKAISQTKDKEYNRMIHILPTDRYNRLCTILAFKYNIELIEINPCYTSYIGKVKYSNKYKNNIHQLASYVIGRKALCKREKLPIQFLNILDKSKINEIEANKTFSSLKKDYELWALYNKTIKEQEKQKIKEAKLKAKEEKAKAKKAKEKVK